MTGVRLKFTVRSFCSVLRERRALAAGFGIIDSGYDLRFLYWVMEHIDFTRYQDAGDLKKITQKPFMQMKYIKPPISMQRDYNAFVDQVDKSKDAGQIEAN